MGYDVTRFQGDVDEDLICPICSGVLEEPVQVSGSKGRFVGATYGSKTTILEGWTSRVPCVLLPFLPPAELWCRGEFVVTRKI